MTTSARIEPGLAEVVERAHRAGLMKLTIIAWRDLDDPAAGGSELHLAHIARRWKEAGLDLSLRTGGVAGGARSLVRDGYPVRRTGGKLETFLRAPAATRVRGVHYDGLVEFWHGVSFLAPLWNRRPMLAIAHHVHQTQFRHVLPGPLARVARLSEAHLYPRVYRSVPIVTLSETTRDDFAELGFRRDRLFVAEPGVNIGFVPGPDDDEPMLVVVARLMPQKRVLAAVAAAIEARRSHPTLRLVLVGEGPERPAIDDLVSRSGVGDWVEVRSGVTFDELVSLYQRAWLVVSASANEGWGMSLSEAAACGTPAVASDISGHRDVVVHGVTGLLTRTDADLARAIDELLADPDRRRRMGSAAREHIARFTWERCAARTLEPLVSATESRNR